MALAAWLAPFASQGAEPPVYQQEQYQKVVQPEGERLDELSNDLKSAKENKEKSDSPDDKPPVPAAESRPPSGGAPPPPPPPPSSSPGGIDATLGTTSSASAKPAGTAAQAALCGDLEGEARRNCESDVPKFARPTAIVISGGVSLGSHQGGLLHYYSQFLGHYSRYMREALSLSGGTDVPVGDIRIATGASAGSINAFLSAMASCRTPENRPEQSLHYRTWIPVGMDGLANDKGITSASVLSREPIDKAICRLRQMWRSGKSGRPAAGKDGAPQTQGTVDDKFQPDSCQAEDPGDSISGAWSSEPCHGQLAFNVTRLEAREIALPFATGAGSVAAKRQTEQFLIEYHKEKGQTEPHFYPVEPPKSAMRSMYPVLGNHGYRQEIELEHVFTLLKASSSFPIAFQPIKVEHQLVTDEGGEHPSLGPVVKNIRFVDGGVFDNTPLGIALTMATWSDQDPYFVFVEPDAIGWKKTAKPGASDRGDTNDTLFGIYGPFVSDFITVSRQAELLSAIATHDRIRGTLQVPPRMMPVASGQILNFLGFFERDFRRFDFYLGMVDAWDYLKTASERTKDGKGGNRQYALLEKADRLPVISDPIFRCFQQLRIADKAGRLHPTSYLPSTCAPLKTTEPNLLALYRTSRDLRQFTQSPEYDEDQEQDRFFALLEAHDFKFHDLKLWNRPVTAGEAQTVVRGRLQRLMHLLSVAQPTFFAENGVAVAGKAALNTIRYRASPSTVEAAFSLGGPGLGASYLLSSATGWRAQVGAWVEPWRRRQLDMTMGASSDWIMDSAGEVLLGKEWAPSIRWQPSLAAGGSIRSVTANRNTFPFVIPREQLVWRYGPTARAQLTLYQRLTFGLAYRYYMDDCAGNNLCLQAKAGGGASYPFVSDRHQLNVFLGWRFIDFGLF